MTQPTAKPTVLIVNDDPAQLHFAAYVLDRDGFEVISCTSAEKAIGALTQRGTVDVIVTDLYMPGIDGWRFCRLLRSQSYAAFNEIPVVVVSATFSGVDAEEVSTQLGANAFLSAPYRPADLRAVVRTVLGNAKSRCAPSVLIVEESGAQAKLVEDTLKANGYTVWTAETGEKGREIFWEKQPDMVLFDYRLPDMSADVLLTEIKSPASSTAVIVMTSDPNPEIALQVIRKGADNFIHKPFSPEYLLEVCSNAARRRALLGVEDLLEQRTRKLRETEERFRNLFENAGDGIVAYSLDGIVMSANREFEALVGSSRDVIVGTAYHRFLAPGCRAAFVARQAEARALKATSWACELEFERADGTVIPVEARCCFLRAHKSHPAAIMAIHRDISARKNLERQRAETVAMLTHDIKNPVSMILGCTELLIDWRSSVDDSTVKKMFVWLRDNALHLKSLLDNYLDFSRIEERRLILASERLELAGLVASVQQRFEAEAHRRGIAVEYRNREPVHVKGDRLALERVISNLLQNALKFTPGGGRITLEVVRRGGEAVVNIADSGPGIEPDQRDALFEKFTRGEWASRQPGVGLGLFIVKELVTAHGGRVQVDSVVGQGSCFSIVLPIENGAPQS